MRRLIISILTAIILSTSSASLVYAQSPSNVILNLGDSYASGPLIPDADFNCQQSTNNYAHIAAREAGAVLYDHSCSGALIENLYESEDSLLFQRPPQLRPIPASPKYILIQIGGNDVRWGDIINQCRSFNTPCRKYYTQHKETLQQVIGSSDNRNSMSGAYHHIRSKYPHSEIIMILRGSHLPHNANHCPAIKAPVNNINYVGQLMTEFNTMLRTVANDVHAKVLDAEEVTTGHDACSADPWYNGDDFIGPTGIIHHPRIEAMQAIAAELNENYIK